MRAVRALAVVALVVMLVAIVSGFVTGDFRGEGSVILGLVWGRVALIDLYVGLAIFGAWLAYRERGPVKVVIWWVALVVLGNLAAGAYLVKGSLGSSDLRELLTRNSYKGKLDPHFPAVTRNRNARAHRSSSMMRASVRR